MRELKLAIKKGALKNTPNDEEHRIQCRCIEYSKTDPRLKWLFAIPNGGQRNISVARKLKREGVKRGVFDLFLPVASLGFHGCFMEVKAPSGTLSDEQKEFQENISSQGYFHVIIRSVEDFKKAIFFYLG
jgi:hypothetical protein